MDAAVLPAPTFPLWVLRSLIDAGVPGFLFARMNLGA